MSKLTLEKLLQNEQDGILLCVQLELLSGVVPKKGAAHSYRRKINKMIDSGDCCINTSTYRKVYLPTLAKAVQRELARRYTDILIGKSVDTEPKDMTAEQVECVFNDWRN